MDEGNPSATKTTLIVAQECSTALLGNTFVHLRRPRVQHGSLGQHFRTSSSPEGAARHAWATPPRVSAARGCSTARLGNTFVHLRRPRVQHGTLGRHLRAFPQPEGAARHAWATLSYIFVARGYSAARLSDTFVLYCRPRVQHGSLGQHFRTSSSPEGATRHAWATPPRVSAARRYWAKDVRLNLTKKEEVSQKRGRLQ